MIEDLKTLWTCVEINKGYLRTVFDLKHKYEEITNNKEISFNKEEHLDKLIKEMESCTHYVDPRPMINEFKKMLEKMDKSKLDLYNKFFFMAKLVYYDKKQPYKFLLKRKRESLDGLKNCYNSLNQIYSQLIEDYSSKDVIALNKAKQNQIYCAILEDINFKQKMLHEVEKEESLCPLSTILYIEEQKLDMIEQHKKEMK